MMKKLLGDFVANREKRFVWLCIAIVMIITGLPYLYGFLIAPANTVYTGIHSLTPGDINVYYSYIEQVKQGHIIFQDLFTSENQPRNLFKPFWLGVGAVASLFHLPSALAVQLVRLALIPIFIFTLYYFLSYVIEDIKTRWLSLMVLLFSSGLGGVLAPFLEPLKYISENGAYYHWPMDLWVPESNTFLTLYHLPHFILSTTLIVASFFFILRAFQEKRLIYSLLAGLCSLALFLFHPFHVVTVWLVPLAAGAILMAARRELSLSWLKSYVIFVLVSAPGLLYQVYLHFSDSFAQQRAGQNILLTPAPWLFLVSYGFLLVFALFGIASIARRLKPGLIFVVVWALVQVALIYSPIFFQRRLSQGLHVPLAVLAALGLIFLWQIVSNRLNKIVAPSVFLERFILAIVFLAFLSGSTIYVLANDIFLYSNRSFPVFYLSDQKAAAFEWIKENTAENSVFLSGEPSGNFIPGWTGRRVYVGHGIETVNRQEKINMMTKFFGNEDWDRKGFLKQEQIDYIYYSDWEEEGADFMPKDKPYLELVFENEDVEIYQVRD